MTKPHLRSAKSKALIALGGTDLLFFGTTNALKVPAYLLIVGFLLMILTTFVLVYALLRAAGLYGWQLKRFKTLALYISGFIAVLVALDSAGQLTIRDLAVLTPLIGLAYTYSAYQKREKTF